MELSEKLCQKIIEFLLSLPSLDTIKGRQAFIYSAVLDSELKNQIPFDQPPAHFIPHLLALLLRYGSLKDERHPLEAVLEAAKAYVGHDKRAYCAILIQSIRMNGAKEFTLPKNIEAYLIRKGTERIGNSLSAIEQQLEEKKRCEEKETAIKEELRRIEHAINSKEKRLLESTKFREAAYWLKKNQENLSVRAGKHVFSDAAEKKLDRFCQEIERFLELIHVYLLTDRQDVLNRPTLRMSFAVELYAEAFRFIVKKIPEYLSDVAIEKLQYAFDLLIERLP